MKEVHEMNNYTLWISNRLVAEVSGDELAYEAWVKVKDLAELLCSNATLVKDNEVIEYYSSEE